MNAPRPNPPETLIKSATVERNRYRFDPAVADNIVLPMELQGIVAARIWKLEPGLFLGSVAQPRRYSTCFVWANLRPRLGNDNGIYAYQLLEYSKTTAGFQAGYVIGIVELAGRVIEHTDGTYRAECCRVLQFLVHTGLAERLSRVYGIPCVTADCGVDATRKMVDWLSSHDGIRCLQWNLQLTADLEAERLMSGLASLSDDLQLFPVNDDIPEDQKDTGGWASQYTNEVKLGCGDGGIVIRNDAIISKYPGGMEAFTFNHPCVYNDDFTMVKDVFPGTLFTALADMADDGLPWHDLVISERWGQLTSKLRQKLAFIAGCMMLRTDETGRLAPDGQESRQASTYWARG